ncbi:histone deacetylase family protein [Azospirillum sp.]|uniref:histone deacetylase family protein n=1 Tax=Azospirillum sp. TaxID=34012 RepID=UPI002D6A4EF6|nr:histone deacetylase family protein [Azospirillum sp.]HYD68222.1 histone deacetylase family protein [Azospirillum sp.]
MYTTLFTHSACLEHDTGLGHPECSDRLRAVLAALDAEDFCLLDRQEAPRATVEQIARAHPQDFVERVLAMIPAEGHSGVDADTVVSPGSGEAALRAAGAVVAAVDAVASGRSRNAFCAVRPPGHHAERERAMGFCLFNNAAVGAYHARAVHGLQRVAVMDFDVHHGNGTQDIFQHDPDLLYCSTHQSPLYPGTGDRGEMGEYGNCVNAPLPAMAGSPEFRHAMTNIVLPAIDHFKPDLIIISAGFDAHSRDPLAGLHLMDDDFAWATRKLGDLARTHCGARIVSVLEGGYNLRALASACSAHVRELMAA